MDKIWFGEQWGLSSPESSSCPRKSTFLWKLRNCYQLFHLQHVPRLAWLCLQEVNLPLYDLYTCLDIWFKTCTAEFFSIKSVGCFNWLLLKTEVSDLLYHSLLPKNIKHLIKLCVHTTYQIPQMWSTCWTIWYVKHQIPKLWNTFYHISEIPNTKHLKYLCSPASAPSPTSVTFPMQIIGF